MDSLSASRFQALKVAGNPILMKDYPVLLENGSVTDRVKCLRHLARGDTYNFRVTYFLLLKDCTCIEWTKEWE